MLIYTNVGLSSKFHAAMSRAPDGAALSLRIVELFLHDKTLKTNKVWNNCVGLIQTVPEVVTKLSTESIEHAKQLAKDWKEMIDNPRSWMTLGSLSSWVLLNFLISYNIVSEFDTKEIFRIFGTIPRKQQRKNHSVLLKGLGLADRIPGTLHLSSLLLMICYALLLKRDIMMLSFSSENMCCSYYFFGL